MVISCFTAMLFLLQMSRCNNTIFSNKNCYTKNEVNIIDTFFCETDSTLYISYETTFETLYSSPGVEVSYTDLKKETIKISFLREYIYNSSQKIKYKSIMGRNFVGSRCVKNALNYSVFNFIVAIPLKIDGRENICSDFIEIDLSK